MGEWRYSFTFLDLGTRWRRVVSFTFRSFYTRGISLGIYCIGGLMGLEAGLDAREKRKILPLLEIEPWPSRP
jgi:hypothetical protein